MEINYIKFWLTKEIIEFGIVVIVLSMAFISWYIWVFFERKKVVKKFVRNAEERGEIQEYGIDSPVSIGILGEQYDDVPPSLENRLIIISKTREKHSRSPSCSQVDLLDVIEWVKKNKPELLK